MGFTVIFPDRKALEVVSSDDIDVAYEAAGLQRGHVDFGTVRQLSNGYTLNIIVYEYGLMKPPEQGRYFSIDRYLYEGSAVLFLADETGETVPCKVKVPVMFYRSHVEVEAAIQRGEINRPECLINGELIWRWPIRKT